MINKRDLRTGNIIRWNDESQDDVIINYIYKDDDYSDEWFVNYFGGEEPDGDALLTEFQGIPLSAELLKQAGFKDESTVNIWCDKITHPQFPFTLIQSMFKTFRISPSNFDLKEIPVGLSWIIINEIKYFHHLQNLAWDLSKVEITLKKSWKMKSYQELIMEHAHINHQTDYIIAVKDCFAILRLEKEIKSLQRDATTNRAAQIILNNTTDEIKSILLKYGIEP